MAESNRIEYKNKLTKAVGLVEYLGFGVPRILESYDKSCFKFAPNFLRMSFPKARIVEKITPQVTPQVKSLLAVLEKTMFRSDIQEALDLSDRENFRLNYLHPALKEGLIEMTIPEKPKSSKQQYRRTSIGDEVNKQK